MRNFRNSTTALTFIAIMTIAGLSSGCDYVAKVIAKDKLNQGAILYNQGKTKQAQAYFKDATERDPNNPIAWLYYGATLYKEYKGLDDKNQQKVIANDALKVYEKALSLSNNCVNKDNAITYIAFIHEDIGNTEENRNWLLKRAEDECSTKEAKASTYYSIAVKYWRCSYDQTTRYQDKKLASTDSFHYRNMDYSPEALQDKKKAEDCTSKGLEYIEKALEADPDYVDAMFYKGLLYRERQKLTKDPAKRKEYEQMALKLNNEASALQKKRQEEATQKQASPQG